jgi:hypothetical protein
MNATDTTLPHRIGLLKPTRTLEAAMHNAALLGADVFGVEVTEPELASRCGLGNLDPQHGPGARAGAPAACEAALSVAPPPAGARLVTLRPDADAFAAMAVLGLRLEGRDLRPAGLELLHRIAQADRFDHGGWRRFHETGGRLASPAVPILAALASEASLSPEARVAAFRRVLQWGELDGPAFELARRRVRESCPVEAVIEARAGGCIAVVRGLGPGVLGLAYRFAPVALAEQTTSFEDASLGRKITLAQFEPGWIDLQAVGRDLNGYEDGWGGTATILGSPQGAGSRLPLDQILRIAAASLLRGPEP